jgi:hypothetical protein
MEEPVFKQRIDKHKMIGVFLETVFSMGAAPRIYNEESLEMAVEEAGEDIVWFVKCSNNLYMCTINPVINPKPVYKSRTSPKT